jgi:spore germination protein YaaH
MHGAPAGLLCWWALTLLASASDTGTASRPASWDVDYGTPLGLCNEASGKPGQFVREWTKATVTMDCAAWTGKIAMKNDDLASASSHSRVPDWLGSRRARADAGANPDTGATRSSSVRVSKVLNYDSWPFGNSTPTDYKLWDWGKLTGVITPYLPAQRPEVAALAKQHNVKLITDWDTLLLTYKFISQHNVSEWSKWIDREVKLRIVDGGMKGINIDIEHMSRTCKGQPSSCRELLSNFTCMLSAALHLQAPLAELSSALSLDPNDEEAGYDYRTMAPCLDYILVMAYSTADRTTPGSTLQLKWVNKSMAQYASMGIPADKLIPLLPWFGHNWPCKKIKNATPVSAEEQAGHRIPVCDPLAVPPGPYRNRSAHPPHDVPGYHWEIGYGEALDLLDLFGPATFGPAWDPSTGSNVYEYVDRLTATRHQVWYESPQSLQVKYGAFAKAGVLGVGMWTGSAFHRGDLAKSKAAATAMWAAVPDRLKADDSSGSQSAAADSRTRLRGGGLAPAARTSAVAGAAAEQPCDIYAAAGTECVAAHSLVRALFGAYRGPLYRVRRRSDNRTSPVGVLAAGGHADAAAQDTFCAGSACVVDMIYDQSARANHLLVGAGGDVATGPGGRASPDFGVDASRLPLSVGGHSVYGAYFEQGMGYRTDNLDGVPCPGVARGNEPETVYMVASGKHYNGACCFDYGNAEMIYKANGTNHIHWTHEGSMEAISIGNSTTYATNMSGWKGGPVPGQIMADLENGLYFGATRLPPRPDLNADFVTALVKGKGGARFTLKGGNAQSGSLETIYDGARPDGPGGLGHPTKLNSYDPMKLQGAPQRRYSHYAPAQHHSSSRVNGF